MVDFAPKTYTSERGLPLAWNSPARESPVLTVEVYEKWYTLYLVMPDGSVRERPFPGASGEESWARLLGSESYYCDHVPNPRAVELMSTHENYLLDPVAYEMIVGRWEVDIKNHY